MDSRIRRKSGGEQHFKQALIYKGFLARSLPLRWDKSVATFTRIMVKCSLIDVNYN